MGAVKYLEISNECSLVAEMGSGKTLMGLGVAHVHSRGKRFDMVVMCPPHITKKWARECIQTIPGVRTFLVEDMRNDGNPDLPHGINEVQLIDGVVKRKGLSFSLPGLRALGKKGWKKKCAGPAVFIVGREKGKLGYYWKHVYAFAGSGPNQGGLINVDTGRPIESPDGGFRIAIADSRTSVRMLFSSSYYVESPAEVG